MDRPATMRTPDAGEGWQLDAALPVVCVTSLDVLDLVGVLVRVLVRVCVKSMCLQAVEIYVSAGVACQYDVQRAPDGGLAPSFPGIIASF